MLPSLHVADELEYGEGSDQAVRFATVLISAFTCITGMLESRKKPLALNTTGSHLSNRSGIHPRSPRRQARRHCASTRHGGVPMASRSGIKQCFASSGKGLDEKAVEWCAGVAVPTSHASRRGDPDGRRSGTKLPFAADEVVAAIVSLQLWGDIILEPWLHTVPLVVFGPTNRTSV